MDVSTEHRFSCTGSLEFEFECPQCSEINELSNPWVTIECKCGHEWKLVARAVTDADYPDDY